MTRIAPPDTREDGGSVGAELGATVGLVLLERDVARKAAIDERPALVAVRAEHDGHVGERTPTVEQSRLIGNLEAVDDRRPLATPGVGYLFDRRGRHAPAEPGRALRSEARKHQRDARRPVQPSAAANSLPCVSASACGSPADDA